MGASSLSGSARAALGWGGSVHSQAPEDRPHRCWLSGGAAGASLSPKHLLSPLEKLLPPTPPAHLLLRPHRPPAAPQQARGAAGGREGAQRAAVLGAGQRRAVPRALLLRPDPRAAGRPVGAALRLREPQRLGLRGGQVSLQHLRPAPPAWTAVRCPEGAPSAPGPLSSTLSPAAPS